MVRVAVFEKHCFTRKSEQISTTFYEKRDMLELKCITHFDTILTSFFKLVIGLLSLGVFSHKKLKYFWKYEFNQSVSIRHFFRLEIVLKDWMHSCHIQFTVLLSFFDELATVKKTLWEWITVQFNKEFVHIWRHAILDIFLTHSPIVILFIIEALLWQNPWSPPPKGRDVNYGRLQTQIWCGKFGKDCWDERFGGTATKIMK